MTTTPPPGAFLWDTGVPIISFSHWFYMVA